MPAPAGAAADHGRRGPRGVRDRQEGWGGRDRVEVVDVTFHTFRHTTASLLFEVGRDVAQVAAWLGHTDPGFTLRTYVHLIDGGVGDAAFLDRCVQWAQESSGTSPDLSNEASQQVQSA